MRDELLMHDRGRGGKVSLEGATRPTWFERLSNRGRYAHPFLYWRVEAWWCWQFWWFDHVTKHLPWYKETPT